MYPEYRNDARVIERKFERQMKKQGFFHTASGQTNFVMDYNDDTVQLRTIKGTKFIEFHRTMLRKAISYMFFKRTAGRKELQVYTNFTSALFGILLHIFRTIGKLEKLKFGEFRLSLLGMVFFASGLEREVYVIEKVLKPLRGKRVVLNFKAILEGTNVLSILDLYDLYGYIDSGAFSFHNQKDKEQLELFDEATLNDFTLEGYADFINENKDNKRILGFLPLDVIGDGKATKENTERLKEMVPGAVIVPVWQITDTIHALKQIVEEEHELIFIGGMVPFVKKNQKGFLRKILKEVFSKFPKQNFHALGMANELLLEFPFFSSDSTAYLNARKYGERKLYKKNGRKADAPAAMSVLDIITQNLRFLLGLEYGVEGEYDLLAR